MAETYINGFNTFVATTMTVGTTMFVTQAAPVASGFRVLVDSEMMLVTSGGNLTTWTVTRGIEGTTIANHFTGAAIIVILTAGSLDALRTQWNGFGTYASKPTSGMKTGDRYRCTDSPYEYIYNGTTWDAYAYGYKVVEPSLAAFTQVAVDKSTFDTTHGGIYQMVVGAGSTEHAQVLAQTLPATPYYVDAAFSMIILANNGGCGSGVSAGTATSNAFALNRVGWESNANWVYESTLNNSTTSWNANRGQINVMPVVPMIWTRVYDDGTTNRTFYISPNGYNWHQMYQEGRTATFTPNQGVLVVSPYNSDFHIHWLHFSMHN